jgi:hypothetical protein
VDVLVSALTSAEERELKLAEEATLAKGAGVRFVRLPADDFGVPRLGEACGPLVALSGDLAEGRTVAVHCRWALGGLPLSRRACT